MIKFYLLISLISAINFAYGQETVSFPSKDQLKVTADLYNPLPPNSPFIILFHQAGWSRGEYLEIAPKLNKMGFNCLAVDQRSGDKVNGVTNETSKRAKKASKKTAFTDAFQDIEGAIDFVKEKYANNHVIIWGSSYSSSLVLKYAGDYPKNVSAVLAFSPGEYFKSTSPTFITSSVANIQVPVFVTSSRSEQKSWQEIYNAIPTTTKQFYLPKTTGNHGSRALWEEFSDHQDYWTAVTAFLEQFL